MASQITTLPARPGATIRHWWALYRDLTKARVVVLVVLTTLVGYLLAPQEAIQWLTLLWTVLGTGLTAASAETFNEVLEVDRDARMPRTRNRPLPTGRVSMAHAVTLATVCGVLGIGLLAVRVNLLTTALGAATLGIYVLIYTPLKVRTSLNTLVGAVVGAIPPIMGWTAATGQIQPGAWVLGAVLFVWQIPHFLALAWLYRSDYASGGYRMLPWIDPTGRLTCTSIILYALVLIPLTLTAALMGISGLIYALGAFILGLWLVKLGIRLYYDRSRANARRLFIASIIYLPLLLGLMVVNAQPHTPDVRVVPVGNGSTASVFPADDSD